MSKHVTISGAGPAGLSAALAVVRAGGAARVFERRSEVGSRFHGDFQGLENWSTRRDVLEELGEMGIEPTFEHVPFRECVFFDPDGKEHVCRSDKPLWYLVRRGSEAGTLDSALKDQALAAGVEIETGTGLDHLPDGGIAAHGPRRIDAIAVGYLFETERADAAYGAVSNDLAAAGYSYLLIAKGRATLATCIFDDFHNDKLYLERTVEFFANKVGVTPTGARRFGGFGNMAASPVLQRGNILFAGEAAGLQDALFGFGMRYAMVSGHLAGQALHDGDPSRYQRACEARLLPFIRAAAVNRSIYSRLGSRGYGVFLRGLCGASDPRAWMRRHYSPSWVSRVLYPLARADLRRREKRSLEHECKDDCDCTFCRCKREIRENERGGGS
jgi:flavin-dependent dehydrogenase